MLRSRGFAAVFIVLGFGVLVGACGGGTSDEDLNQARNEGAQQARQQAKLDALEEKVKQLEDGGGSDSSATGAGTDNAGSDGSGVGPGPVTTCADGVQVGPKTSCAFAMNVAGEYGSNPGATTISTSSPSTGRMYTMTCSSWSGGGTVCRGGNGAAVYLR